MYSIEWKFQNFIFEVFLVLPKLPGDQNKLARHQNFFLKGQWEKKIAFLQC
jgi:hypothetical protein